MGRLDEITEDGEDAGAEVGSIASGNVSSSSLSGAQRYKAARRAENLSRRTERAERSTASLQVRGESPLSLSSSRRSTPPASPLKPAIAQFLVRENSGETSITELEPTVDNAPSDETETETENRAAAAGTDDLHTIETERLDSDPVRETEAQHTPDTVPMEAPAPEPDQPVPAPESSRNEDTDYPPSEHHAVSEANTSIRGVSMDEDPYDLSKYDKYFKPKVKLGPRPVTAAERAMRSSAARVSAVPASLKHARKQEPARPISQGGDSTTPTTTAVQFDMPTRMPPPIPAEYSPRPYSRSSVKSAPSHRSMGMTPDRLRLKKAVELRKRQLRKSQEPSSFIPPVEEEIPEMPRLQHSRTAPLPGSVMSVDETVGHRDPETEQANTDDESHAQSIKADSGIEIRYDTPGYDDADERATSQHEDTSAVPSPTATIQPAAIDEQSMSPLFNAVREITETGVLSDSPDEVIPKSDINTSIALPSVEEPAKDASEAMKQTAQTDHSVAVVHDGDAGVEASLPASSQSSDTLRSVEATTEPAPADLSRPVSSDLSKRRRGLVEPLHVDISSGNPDDFMSDDEFLDELHTATVQEALPIVVARSPISSPSPVIQPSLEDISAVRSVSITRNIPRLSTQKSHTEENNLPHEPSPALLSISTPEKADPARNAARKVSSGISRRIQALNEMSTREANVSGYNVASRPLTPDTSPNTFLHQDHKGRGPRKAPSPAARQVSFRRLSKNSSVSLAPATTSPTESAPVWNVHHDPVTSRNSVSVTARIVRPRTEPSQERLMQSELMINHSRDQPSRSNLNLPPIDVDTAQQSNVSSPALSPASRGSSDARTLHSASRFGRRRKTSTTPATPEMDEFPHPPNQSRSADSINDENATPKTSTRTSRFFKRVSNLSGPKRRRSVHSVMSTTSFVSLESGKESRAANRASVATHRSDTPPAVVVGDLNVQFPDSLVRQPPATSHFRNTDTPITQLWKRRIVTISEDGHLQFAIAHAMEIHKGVALRHFPLQEFSVPYAPDLDRQELANSVVLELQDGTTLQLACEDSMTQRQVLHLLKSYWKSWATA